MAVWGRGVILRGPDVTMRWRWAPLFRPEEFACKCACASTVIDTDLLDALHELRIEFDRPMVISSGYRCASHNVLVSGTGPNGPHTTGSAADVSVSGLAAWDLLVLAAAHPRITGIGVNQKGPMGSRFLHLDVLPVNGRQHPRPRIWSY